MEFLLTNWLIELRSPGKGFKVFIPSKEKPKVYQMSKLVKVRNFRSQPRP